MVKRKVNSSGPKGLGMSMVCGHSMHILSTYVHISCRQLVAVVSVKCATVRSLAQAADICREEVAYV